MAKKNPISAATALQPQDMALGAVSAKLISAIRQVAARRRQGVDGRRANPAEACKPLRDALRQLARAWIFPNGFGGACARQADSGDTSPVGDLLRALHQLFAHCNWRLGYEGELYKMVTHPRDSLPNQRAADALAYWPCFTPVPANLLDTVEHAAAKVAPPTPDNAIGENNGGADTKADTSKKIPKNLDAMALARELEKPSNKGRTKIEIARDYCEENGVTSAKPESLLRKIRGSTLQRNRRGQ